MDKNTLAIRKHAMEKRKDWGFGGLNPQPNDRAGSEVSAKWNHVVTVTDGGTAEQIQAAVAAAEQAEKDFANEWH